MIQQYTDATDRWIGPPDSEIARGAHDDHGVRDAGRRDQHRVGRSPRPQAGSAAAAQQAARDGGGEDEDSDTLPLVLSIAALVAALAALALALIGRRRRT